VKCAVWCRVRYCILDGGGQGELDLRVSGCDVGVFLLEEEWGIYRFYIL